MYVYDDGLWLAYIGAEKTDQLLRHVREGLAHSLTYPGGGRSVEYSSRFLSARSRAFIPLTHAQCSHWQHLSSYTGLLLNDGWTRQFWCAIFFSERNIICAQHMPKSDWVFVYLFPNKIPPKGIGCINKRRTHSKCFMQTLN